MILCKITPLDDLYFPLLPEQAPSGKVLFHLQPMVGTWASFEVHFTVQNGFVIDEIFEQHHFLEHSFQGLQRYIL